MKLKRIDPRYHLIFKKIFTWDPDARPTAAEIAAAFT
jgi:hypothetical protein